MHFLCQRDTFRDANVGLPRARSASHITRSIPKCPWGWYCECSGINPLRSCLAARWLEGNARHQIGPLIVRVAVGYIRRASVYGDVYRETATRTDDLIQLPRTEKTTQDSWLIQVRPAAAERKLVHCICIQNVTSVKCAAGALTWPASNVLRS